jgi:hypothetical protein
LFVFRRKANEDDDLGLAFGRTQLIIGILVWLFPEGKQRGRSSLLFSEKAIKDRDFGLPSVERQLKMAIFLCLFVRGN